MVDVKFMSKNVWMPIEPEAKGGESNKAKDKKRCRCEGFCPSWFTCQELLQELGFLLDTGWFQMPGDNTGA